jgi:hypothetical protein
VLVGKLADGNVAGWERRLVGKELARTWTYRNGWVGGKMGLWTVGTGRWERELVGRCVGGKVG